jgi:hypothetical protein
MRLVGHYQVIHEMRRSLGHLQQFPATFTPLLQITGKKLLHHLNFKGWNFKSSCKMRRTVLGDKCKATEWRRANAEDYAEIHVPLGAHFPVFVQFEGDQEASC